MEPRTNRQKQAAATKTKIFRCAIALFTQKSYENVTVNDICKEAQVSVGAFYHHFPNKESILNEGYRMFDQQIYERWESFRPTSHREAIGFLIRGQLESMHNSGALGASQYFKNQLSNKNKYILDKNRFFYRTLLQEVEGEVRLGGLHGDPAAITGDILRISRGTIYDWCLHDGGYDLVRQGIKYLDMVLSYYEKR